MTAASAARTRRPRLSPAARRIVLAAIVVVVVAVMAVSTRYVPAGAEVAGAPAAFDATTYGAKQFPIQQKAIAAKAVDAATLGKAVAADATAAGKQYGVASNGGASTIVPVKFTGTVGKVPAAGYTPVKIEGLPSGTTVAVQLGPAINGTDLRDATGTIMLGDFENQIQYQDAGTAINDQLKAVLTKAGAPDLEGKTVEITGVFPLVNPKAWNVTPSAITVQP